MAKGSGHLDKEWKDLSASIDLFLVEHEGKYDDGRLRIIKSHWIHDKERKQCSNKECQTSFSLTERRHHCRRCGEIFCNKCTQYTQRLSLLAQRDPEGTLYKVCITCFNREGQSFGQTRKHMGTFSSIRCEHQKRTIVVTEETDLVDGDTTLNISHRLGRLTARFQDHLNGNRTKSGVIDFVKSSVAVPPWQIPSCGLKSSRFCSLCTKQFSLLDSAHHCRVCGEAVCLNCSSEELLLYIADDCSEGEACWAVINVTGCPREPPMIRDCLRLCTRCHSHAVHSKLQNIVKEQHEDEEDVLKNVDNYYTQLSDTKIKIDDVLRKYQELVNAIEHEKDLGNVLPKGESTTKVLAKYNSDTSDLFTQFAIDMQGFKKVRPRTSTQLKLMSSIINAMHRYYTKYFFTFRDLQRSLDSSLGYRVLESVQIIVDYQTINCTFLALRQLGLECLELCHKYNFDISLASILATCEEICKKDLQKAVRSSGENWEQHEENIQEFLRVRLKENKLIPSSKTKKSAKSVEELLFRRCDLSLIKVKRQLNAKASANKFKETKEALENTYLNIKELCKEA